MCRQQAWLSRKLQVSAVNQGGDMGQISDLNPHGKLAEPPPPTQIHHPVHPCGVRVIPLPCRRLLV
jgi:hypothetical protein